jgi:dihydroorotate dehydrogenase (NAD+) catalytic subunit
MKTPKLSVNIAGVSFSNPVIAASGSFGFGREYSKLFALNKLGGISLKGMTLEERMGNASPRSTETPSGMLNSVGLQNPGVEAFIKNDLKWLKEQGTRLICNIAGNTIEDYCRIAERLADTDIDMLELNISCPNVKEGGVAFGTSCASVERITKEVKKYAKQPLMVKLSPNVTDIAEIAASAESAGADAVSLINTLLGMRIDINTRKPILYNNVGGLSGPAVFPVALRMVWQVANRVKIPVIGMGGIAKWQDAVEMMLAGASAVQVGTATFTDPFTMINIIDGLNSYCRDNNIDDIMSIVGGVIPNK